MPGRRRPDTYPRAVLDAFVVALVAGSVVCAVWAAVAAVRGRRPGDRQLIALAILEVAVLAQVLVAGVRLAAGHDVDSVATVAGYLLAAALALPAGVFWGIADHSRWGNTVVAASCLVVVVLLVRLQQVWGA